MPATIHDVARRAAVSAATVSRVVSGSRAVNPVLAERVQTAVAELGYEPNRLARGLRTQRAQVWGLVISDIRNPFFTDMVRGIEDAASESDHSLVLCNSDEDLDKERGYLDLIASERMAGAILAPADSGRTDPAGLLAHGIPVVTVDRRLTSADLDAVVVDSVGGSEDAVTHLVDQGYRRIGCITGPATTTTGAERLEGYRRALARARIHVEPELIRIGDFKETSARRAAIELLGLADPPEAIFCANNLMTLGMLRALSESAVRIPDDVAVAAFDDPEWAPLVEPPITSVAQPVYEMGRKAGELLLGRINGDRSPARTIRFRPTLRIRASSGPNGRTR